MNQVYEHIAKHFNVSLSSNEELVTDIINKLEHNQQQYKARYCPSRSVHSVDNICPCKKFRITRYCNCGIFINVR